MRRSETKFGDKRRPSSISRVIPALLNRFGMGRMAHNTVLSTFWQFVRIGTQVVWLILIARTMGPIGYGTFAGLAGLATTLAGLSGLGSGILLVKHVALDPGTFGERWRRTLTTTLLSGMLLAIPFVWLASQVAQPYASLSAVCLIGVSELVFFPLVFVAGQAFQAHERLGWAGLVHCLMGFSRMLAVVLFSASGVTKDLETYAVFHFVSSCIAMAGVLLIVELTLKPIGRLGLPGMQEIREGLGFSASWFTGNGLVELDKTLTLRLAGPEVAGLYSVAYRLVSVFTLPVAALTLAAQPRLFRKGHSVDATTSHHLERHLLVSTTIYAVVASVAMYFLAGVLPWLLGDGFESAVEAARLLILVPPLFSIRLLGSTILMTSGHQARRVVIELLGLGLLIILAVAWIPSFGLKGAAMTVTTIEGLLAAAIWTLIWRQRQTGSRVQSPSNDEPASRRNK